MYLINDQPNTCPECGARTDEIGSFYHTKEKYGVEMCLNGTCGKILTFCEDEELNEMMGFEYR